MCRNIRQLFNFEPPATSTEIDDAAMQFVRKVGGSATAARANAEVTRRAVAAVAAATQELLDQLVTTAPARDREVEAQRARERSAARFGGAAATGRSG